MDYEKKYNEALERARLLYGGPDDAELEEIFPELVESEDERIRKNIIAYFDAMRDKNLPNGMKQPILDAWIAYLEKQKEKKEDGK